MGSDVIRSRQEDDTASAWLLGLGTVLLVLTPWSWYTIGFDFHFEAFGALFALLAARDLWAGRYVRSLALWIPLTLVCGAAPGALLVVGLGFVALLRAPVRHAAGASASSS